jgi:hypothetical protein
MDAAKQLEREFGAAVWLHHDAEAQREVCPGPEFYEQTSPSAADLVDDCGLQHATHPSTQAQEPPRGRRGTRKAD